MRLNFYPRNSSPTEQKGEILLEKYFVMEFMYLTDKSMMENFPKYSGENFMC